MNSIGQILLHALVSHTHMPLKPKTYDSHEFERNKHYDVSFLARTSNLEYYQPQIVHSNTLY
jgi:hypothetical protein